MTNFEYVKSLNKEELAVFLSLQDIDHDKFDQSINQYDNWLDQETEFNDSDKADYKFLYASAKNLIDNEENNNEECET